MVTGWRPQSKSPSPFSVNGPEPDPESTTLPSMLITALTGGQPGRGRTCASTFTCLVWSPLHSSATSAVTTEAGQQSHGCTSNPTSNGGQSRGDTSVSMAV